MEKRNNSRGLLSRIMGNIFASWTLVAAAAAAAGAIVLTLVHLNRNTTISIGSDNIASMKSIGEWEFLSISDEEMIDTVRHGFFSDDELVRIYYGTLRLGIDMSQADADWIAHSGDSVTVTLPPVKLLVIPPITPPVTSSSKSSFKALLLFISFVFILNSSYDSFSLIILFSIFLYN